MGKTSNIFGPALAEMERSGQPLFGPVCFQDYCKEHGIIARNTAQHISVDSLERLAPELKAAKTMVFRLGSPKGSRGTQFALVRSPGRIEDFFLMDEELFSGVEVKEFLPAPEIQEKLLAYQIMGPVTEATLVNFALASGLMAEALDLDQKGPILAPATVRSTYSFSFRPHPDMDIELFHDNGQVEIDALFAERRKGKQTLFVLEAKMGGRERSLARHKLLYPVRAMEGQILDEIEIVNIYVRIKKMKGTIGYFFGGNVPSVAMLSNWV